MRIGIVGSRDFPRLEFVRSVVNIVRPEDVLISGGAMGVDRMAESKFCNSMCSEKPIIHRPDFEVNGTKFNNRDFHKRNKKIVDDSDILIMFWDKKSPGTLSTLKALIEHLEKPKIGPGQITLEVGK